MVSDPRDEQFERRAKALFDAGVNGIDAHTRSRLTQARRAAVAERERHRASWLSRYAVPASGFATAALVLMVAFNAGAPDKQGAALGMDDVAMLADGEDFDLLEDMDFYSWLDSEEGELGGDAAGQS